MLRRGLLIAAAFLALGATASAAPRASLRVTGSKPLALSGRHFHARERVRVTLTPSSGGPVVRHVTASRGGRFSVTFKHVPVGPCGGFSAVATGSGGSRAMLARMHPDCLTR
jgi:hypothetical protein